MSSKNPKVKGGDASVEIVNIGEVGSFTGKDGAKVQKRDLMVVFSGPVKVTAYGSNVQVIEDLKLEKGDHVAYMLRKSPSITLR